MNIPLSLISRESLRGIVGVAFFVTTLASCGGGGGSNDGSLDINNTIPNRTPTLQPIAPVEALEGEQIAVRLSLPIQMEMHSRSPLVALTRFSFM